MHISNDRYFRERQRHDLALRMIRHEARTCTIRSCTGLTDDRIRKLYKTYAEHSENVPIRRKRGKSPRQIAYFTRNPQVQFEAALLASTFAAFGLVRDKHGPELGLSLEFGRMFCDAYETHRQLPHTDVISFEHAWFLLQLLNRTGGAAAIRCRYCHGHYLRYLETVVHRSCPACKLKGHRPRARASRSRLRITPHPAITHLPSSVLRV